MDKRTKRTVAKYTLLTIVSMFALAIVGVLFLVAWYLPIIVLAILAFVALLVWCLDQLWL